MFNALTISTTIGRDCRDYYAIELVFSLSNPPEDQLKIIYDPYCKKVNALTISTPVGIDFRDYFAIELVYHY